MKPPAALSLLLLLAAACDAGPRVVVRATLDGRPVADLPVHLLPYDRQRLQDSLRDALQEDAPAVPEELLGRLAGVDSALARPAADSAAQARADSLRTVRAGLAARADSARERLRAWEQEVALRADSLGLARADADDRLAASDTTDAAGRAALPASPGQSWVRARYILTDAVMEWNVPVALPADQDSVVLELNQGNARRLQP